MRNFNLADDFTDAAAERSFLASLVSYSDLRKKFGDRVTGTLFPSEPQAAQSVLSGTPDPSVFAWQQAADPDACLRVLLDLQKRRDLADLQERLGELLYDPSRPVDDAAVLLEQWRSKAASATAARTVPPPTSGELLDRLLGDANHRYEKRKAGGGAIAGILTGLPKVDALLNGLCPGLHVLGGAPGAGKTTLALQISVHAAIAGVPVLYLSFENTPANLMLKAVCAQAELVPLDVERGYGDLPKLKAASEKLRPALERLSILEGTLRLSMEGIRAAAEKQFQGRNGLVVVDYLQRAAHQHGYEQLRQNVSRLAAELRELSSALDSPVLALASQNRSGGDYGRGGGSAQLDSLKESGDLEYAADSVMFLRADHKRTFGEPVRAIELAVVKNRFGPLGAIPLVYRADVGYLREDGKEPLYALQWTSDK